MKKRKNLLVVFVRNPEKGKVKKRLAEKIGKDSALELYRHLLRHTVEICRTLPVDRRVYYSDFIEREDVWKKSNFEQQIQYGDDLGERMKNAFREGFRDGYTGIVLIGSDLWELDKEILEKAFLELERYDFTLGPAQDGGYYLIGMSRLKESLFNNKNWGTDTVLQHTLQDLKEESLILLEERNDIDTVEDLKIYPELRHFINTNE